MGIIVLVLGIGGLQLVRAETPGPIKDSKLTPRNIHETAKTFGIFIWDLTIAMHFLLVMWV